MYEKIKDLCKIRNMGGSLHNSKNEFPPRFDFILNLVKDYGFNYHIEKFTNPRFIDNSFYNLYLKGDSDNMVIAHHDILNPYSDNANDNSASIINCLELKRLIPELNVAIIDGEEPPLCGIGSQKLSKDIKRGEFKKISHVLNLELTGVGGDNFFVGELGSKLEEKIIKLFNPLVMRPPFNDSDILMENGIDSTVVTTFPMKNDKPDLDILNYCHSEKDSLDTISINDMKIFVDKIAHKILTS